LSATWPSPPRTICAPNFELLPELSPRAHLVERLQNQLALLLALADDARAHLQGGRTEQALEVLDEIVESRRCASCGCTETSACEGEHGPCGWAEADLCTECVP
jgi:hypothetical protein